MVHEPFSWGYFVKCNYNNSLSKYISYRGVNSAQNFINTLRCHVIDIYYNHLNKNVPMRPLTIEEENSFISSSNCFICNKVLGSDRVRDHCHLTGKFRGAAHNVCKLNYKVPQFIPIFFHNLSGYDAHLFIKELWSEKHDKDIFQVIPLSLENYISMSLKIKLTDSLKNEQQYFELRFLDSFRFLASSLENLAKGLNVSEFTETINAFDKSNMDLVLQKGIFPYEYITSVDKLNETVLPPKESFFSSLTNSHITVKDYDHALKVWERFKARTIGEYSDIYLKIDVFLLTDVFEKFRNVCLSMYDLDPAHYYTLPGFSWSAMLKYTGVHLELLSDIEMIHFIKRGIRGGISQCSKRHAEANNKYMEHFDETKPSKYLMYFDANNQYGWAMSQNLPYGNFKWLDDNEISKLTLERMESDENVGYILEVDLEYPQTLHDAHNDYPFCAEKMVPPMSNRNYPKLIPNLMNKKNYIIHYKNLIQCIDHGLKLIAIHRAVSFNQSCWMKKYIDLNNEKRASTSNKFEQDTLKLCNNGVYGKTIENTENYRCVKFCNKWSRKHKSIGARELISHPNFLSCKIINENFVIIEMKKGEVNYNKPFYIGFSVLEISKTLMYNFHYNYMKKKFNNKLTMLYTDTDSFIYEIATHDDFYDEMKNNSLFDTSNYALDNVYKIPLLNKQKLGAFKDENCGNIMVEFVGLRSKSYALRVDNGKIIKKAKGVTRCTVKDQLTFQNYLECLQQNSIKYCQMTIFKSINHNIFTQKVNKSSLSASDDKRFLIKDSNETYAWGHYRIQELMNE